MDRKEYWAAGAALVGALILLGRSRRAAHPPLPPGPKADPLIGNLRAFPQNRWYETFSSWQAIYGDMIYMNVLGNRFIVLNSLDIADELLIKRGVIHAGRPMDAMNYYVMGWDWNVVMAQPGDFHSDCRTIFKRGIGQQEVVAYDRVILEECHQLVEALHGFQGDPWEQVYSATGAIVTRITFGDSIYREIGKELTELNRETLDLVTRVSTQAWLVNFVPSLRHLPDWLPLPFKKVGRYGYALQERMHLWPWAETTRHFKAGIAEPSLALEYIEKNETVEIARDALGMMYAAGVDNTASTFMSFIGIMMRHPEVQKKAQMEMDRELGRHGTPRFEDRDRLPYMDAVWKESVRMNPSTALGVPHAAMQDDVYNGMFIPQGTWLLTNIGFMCRDPRIWGDGDNYRPERWLPEHNPNAASLPDVEFTFGFGRRICPGQFLAERTNFTFAAALLKAYDILPPPGETLPEEFVYKDAIIRRPESFRCQFRPRKMN